ncbi:kelch repeat-containing protein [Bacillus sp. Bos-x628]|uniref:Kelch repeat-containing protein n=1 Tax=Bacillus maqinnsis TaxID=3229854 RepID=UPI00338F2575
MKKGFLLFVTVLLLFSTFSPLKALATNSSGWTKRADLPEERINAGIGVVDGKIYVFGGASEKKKLNNQMFMYDPKEDIWVEKSTMPRNRTGGTYATVGKKIYAIGGINDETQTVYNTIDVYDTERDQWAEKPIQIPRNPVFSIYNKGTLSAVAIKDHIYLVSALDSKNNFYRYDTVTGAWDSLNSSELPSRNGRAISAIDGKIYVAGGENSIGHSSEKYLFQYDIETNTWKRLIDVKLTSYTYEPSYVTHNGNFIIIGGQRIGYSSSELLKQVQIFNPKEGQFQNSKHDLPEGRVASVAAIVDDQLYVIGGRNYSYSMAHLSVKSDFKSVVSIPLKDLHITEAGTKPDDDTTEKPKDEDGTKPDDDTTEKPKDKDGAKPGDDTTEKPKDKDGTKPDDNQHSETEKGILSITMINGLQKDYLLSMKEINDFLNWYKERSFGIGINFFEIKDEHNKGPFTSKKDYVVYQNILMFDVKQY